MELEVLVARAIRAGLELEPHALISMNAQHHSTHVVETQHVPTKTGASLVHAITVLAKQLPNKLELMYFNALISLDADQIHA